MNDATRQSVSPSGNDTEKTHGPESQVFVASRWGCGLVENWVQVAIGFGLGQSHEALVRMKWRAFRCGRTGRYWACRQARLVRSFPPLRPNDEEDGKYGYRQQRDSTTNAARDSTNGHATPTRSGWAWGSGRCRCQLGNCELATGGDELCIAIVNLVK